VTDLDGVLVVDKPAGKTSAQVVAMVRKRLGIRRIGHTGTLDPMATGVLPLVLGQGTKIAAYLLADDKEYEGTIELGVSTDTLDADGVVVDEHRDQARALTCAQIEAALSSLRGAIEQVPPMYSALKHHGRRLHELARKGETVERPARAITVHRFEVTRCAPPVLDFDVACSKGTYVRALARDLGAALGVGAHLRRLRRTRSGAFGIADAVRLDDLDPGLASEKLWPLGRAIAHLPAIYPGPEHLRRIAHGLPRRAAEVAPEQTEGTVFQCLTPDGRLLALARVEGEEVRYERVFPGVFTGDGKG